MTYKVCIFNDCGPGTTDAPDWYNNLSAALFAQDPFTRSAEEYYARFGLVFSTDNPEHPYGKRYLEFPDEKTYLMFVLKYS